MHVLYGGSGRSGTVKKISKGFEGDERKDIY